MSDKEKKDEELLETDGRFMTKNDVNKYITEILSAGSKAYYCFGSLSTVIPYEQFVDALNNYANALKNGSYMDFARRNRWIKTQRAEFLSGTSAEQDSGDRQAVVQLYGLATNVASYTDAVCAFFNSISGEVLKTAYRTILFYNKMCDYQKTHKVMFSNSAVEFMGLYQMFNESSIYDTVLVSKTDYTFEENYEIVLDYLDAYLRKTRDLVKVVDPAQVNAVYTFDKDSRAFNDMLNMEPQFIQARDKANQLAETAKGYKAAYCEVWSYFEGIINAMTAISKFFGYVFDIIEGFMRGEGDGYCMMCYPKDVMMAANKYLMCSLPNPMTQGTRYGEIFKNMTTRLKDLAKTVAKLAPARSLADMK